MAHKQGKEEEKRRHETSPVVSTARVVEFPQNMETSSMERKSKRCQSVDEEWRLGTRTLGQQRRTISATVDEDVNRATRVSLIIFNLLIMLISLVVLWGSVVAIWVRPPNQGGFWVHVHNNAIFAIAMHMELLFLTLSLFSFASASFGMLGALRENTRLLSIYNRCLLGGILVVSSGLVVFCLFPSSLKYALKERYFSDFIVNYRSSPDFQKLVDSAQEYFRCCGISDENFRDWDLNPYFTCDDDNPSRERCNVPYSCCKANVTYERLPLSKLCGAKMLAVSDEEAWEHIYVRSCADAIVSAIHNNTGKVLLACVLLNFVVLILLTTSIHLRREINVMSSIYNAYYDNLIEGQEKMKREGIVLPSQNPEGPEGLLQKYWARIYNVLLRKEPDDEESRNGEPAPQSGERRPGFVLKRCQV